MALDVREGFVEDIRGAESGRKNDGTSDVNVTFQNFQINILCKMNNMIQHAYLCILCNNTQQSWSQQTGA